jgi:hypothetical protein
LVRKIWIEGTTEFDVPAAHVLRDGVLVSHNNYIGLYSHGLEHVRWFHEPPGARGSLGLFLGSSNSILHKPEGSVLTQYKVDTGAFVRSIETQAKDGLVGASDHNFLLMSIEEQTLMAFDWSGKLAWRWKYDAFCDLVSTPESYVVVEKGTRLHVLDAFSGKNLWKFEAELTGDKGLQDRSNRLVSGFPSVVALDDQLMIVLGDGRIFKLDLRTGEVIKTGHTPFRGPYQVGRQSVFILSQQSCRFAEYNHVLMREVSNVDLRKEMEPLFKGNQPSINALLVSEDSIVWTTMYGMLMGLERTASSGKKGLAGWILFRDRSCPLAFPQKLVPDICTTPQFQGSPELRRD